LLRFGIHYNVSFPFKANRAAWQIWNPRKENCNLFPLLVLYIEKGRRIGKEDLWQF
jgi:hypothetical protein